MLSGIPNNAAKPEQEAEKAFPEALCEVMKMPLALSNAVLCLGFSLEYKGRDAFVDEIYIRAAFRGQGLGKRALEFPEAECRALGVQALHLEVERANTNAQEVYRKHGFIDQDRYLMTKPLGK